MADTPNPTPNPDPTDWQIEGVGDPTSLGYAWPFAAGRVSG